MASAHDWCWSISIWWPGDSCNTSWSIFTCQRLTRIWRCAALALRIRRPSHQPDRSSGSSAISVCHCAVSCVRASQTIWRNKGAVAAFAQNVCEIAWLSWKCRTLTCQMVFKVLVFAQLLITAFTKTRSIWWCWAWDREHWEKVFLWQLSHFPQIRNDLSCV